MQPLPRNPNLRRFIRAGAGGLLPAVFALILPASAAAEAFLVHQETFANATGVSRPLAPSGWHYFLGPAGFDEADNPATATLATEAVGVKPDGGGEDRGRVVNALGPDGTDPDDDWNQVTLYATENFSMDLSRQPLTGLRVDLATSQRDETRFAVRVDGRWFASKEPFLGVVLPGHRVSDNFATSAKPVSMNAAGAAWVPLSFEPGVTLGLDTGADAVPLPAGTLDGLGLFLQPTGFEAFDNLTVLSSKPAAPATPR